jgi:hypothetical protein
MTRIAEMVMKLNGWQRLWIVFSLLWLLAVFVVAYSKWPIAASISRLEIYRRLSSDSARFISNYELVMNGDPAADWMILPTPLPHFEVVDVSGHVIIFARPSPECPTCGTPDDQKERILRECRAVLRQLLSDGRRSIIEQTSARALVPPIAIYLLGWSVAWVRRGFAIG